MLDLSGVAWGDALLGVLRAAGDKLSLHYIRLQHLLHTVTASITYGYSLHYAR